MFHGLIYFSRGIKLGAAIATIGGAVLKLVKRHQQDMARAEQTGALRGAVATYSYTAEHGCMRCNGD